MTDYSEIEHAPRLVSAWPEEVRYKMFIAYESAYHAGVRPRGAAPFRTTSTPKDTESSGLESRPGDPEAAERGPTSQLNVGPGVDPGASLGVRVWYAGDPELHDVYNEPEQGTEFTSSPEVSMGVLEFDESSDRTLEVSEFGRRFTESATIHVPVYHHYLNDLPAPTEGDMVEFWGESWESLGVFYDVVKCDRRGFMGGTSYFTHWQVELQRNDEYVPERRLLGE